MASSLSTSSMYTNMSPAYTPVSTRRTLGPAGNGVSHTSPYISESKAATQPQTQQPQNKVWPLPVREYVSRSFAEEYRIPGITPEDMQARLRVVINDAVSSGMLETLDWANYPLPQQLIETERQQASYNSPSAVGTLRNTFPNAMAFTSDKSTNHSSTRKRKSGEVDAQTDELDLFSGGSAETSGAPWRQNKNGNPFEDRLTYSSSAQAKRVEKRQRKSKDSPAFNSQSSKLSGDIEKRKQRFGYDNTQDYLTTSRDDSPLGDANSGPVIGTCQDLEKRYFRLTAPPKPETVRPLPVLKQTLELLKTKWKQDNNYTYICDQFKSLRQDLTVQHIKNDFTVDVYELHARIALEKGDMGEYNQCQTQLRALYKQKLGGHPGEFLAYRILYFIYTCNRTDMNDVLADLTSTDRTMPAVKHALEVRSALALGNYHRFFKLSHEAPNMGAYLLDLILQRERLAALANMCKSYRPDLSLKFVSEELGFDNEQDCCQFICDQGGDMLFEEKPEGIRFKCPLGLPVFEAKKSEAFRRIDIKGQI